MKPSDLYARIKKTEEEAAALKAFWESALTCPPPPDFDLKNLVRRFSLDHLVTGIEAYAAEIAKKEKLVLLCKEPTFQVNTQNAKDYICATAWYILEKEEPAQRPLTSRRMRKDLTDPSSPNWDSDAWHNATPKERQTALAIQIAREEAEKDGGKR